MLTQNMSTEQHVKYDLNNDTIPEGNFSGRGLAKNLLEMVGLALRKAHPLAPSVTSFPAENGLLILSLRCLRMPHIAGLRAFLVAFAQRKRNGPAA